MKNGRKIIAIITIGTFLFSLAPAESVLALRPPETPEQVSGSAGGLQRDLKTAAKAIGTPYEKTLSIIKQEAEGDKEFERQNTKILDKFFEYFSGVDNLEDLIKAIHRQQKETKVVKKDIPEAKARQEWVLEQIALRTWKLLNIARAIPEDVVKDKGKTKEVDEDLQECKKRLEEEPDTCRLDPVKLTRDEGELLYRWRRYFIHCNIFPGFEGHLMITYQGHEPQFVNENVIRDMMELAFEKLPDYRIFYNHVSRRKDNSIYANCGSSIPYHNHCQAIPRHLSDELTDGLPVENASLTEQIATMGGVSIRKLVDYPSTALVVEGSNSESVAFQASAIIDILNKKIEDSIEGVETGIVGYNILWTKKADKARIIIFPRAKGNRPSIAVQDGDERDLYSGNKKKGITGIKNKLLEEYQKENLEADMDALAGLSKDKVEQLFERINPTEEERRVFDKFDIGIASVEMSGIVVLTNRRDFERFTLGELQGILDQSSTPEKFLEPIYEQLIIEESIGDESRLQAAKRLKKLVKRGESKAEARTEVDLHLHTYHSDGYQTPTAIVYEAYLKGLKAVAITDHNSFEGIPEALKAGEIFGIKVIPGIEIETDINGIEILGYFPDADRFMEWFKGRPRSLLPKLIQEAQVNQVEKMLTNIKKLLPDKPLSPEEVMQLARHKPYTLGNLYTAFKQKYGKQLQEVVKQKGIDWKKVRPEPEKVANDPEAVIKYITRIGGIPILAHPSKIQERLESTSKEVVDKIEEYVSYGLAGIEANSSHHSQKDIDFYANFVTNFNEQHPQQQLIITAGSDYHGEYSPDIRMAAGSISPITPNGNMFERLGRYDIVRKLKEKALAEIKVRLIEKLAPYIEQGGYALVLHPEPAGKDAKIIESRLSELGFDPKRIVTVDTPEKAEAYLKNPAYNIICVVNRLLDFDLAALIAGLGIADVSGNVASFVPETAKDLEIWL